MRPGQACNLPGCLAHTPLSTPLSAGAPGQQHSPPFQPRPGIGRPYRPRTHPPGVPWGGGGACQLAPRGREAGRHPSTPAQSQPSPAHTPHALPNPLSTLPGPGPGLYLSNWVWSRAPAIYIVHGMCGFGMGPPTVPPHLPAPQPAAASRLSGPISL